MTYQKRHKEIPENGTIGFYKEPEECYFCDRKTYLFEVEVFLKPSDLIIEHPLCPQCYKELKLSRKHMFDNVKSV